MKNRVFNAFLIVCCALIFGISEVLAQCTTCSVTKTYNGTSGGSVTNNNPNWSPSGKVSDGSTIVGFSGSNASYLWQENDLQIGGIVLSNGADLTLDRGNLGNNPGFTIEGGCITVGAGSILTLGYISSLKDLTICVEEGGQLVFDSRESTRNDFNLDNVEINLQGPNSEIVIGEADFFLGTNGISINGFTGSSTGVCPISTPNTGGSTGNISWTSSSDGDEVCKILNANSACGPAGCDVIVSGGTITGTITDGATICIKGNRGYSIDLQNKNDLTICVSAGVTLSGLFTNYNSANKITVNVYGTVTGSLTMNNSESSFNVFSGGKYNSYGTLDIQKGTASNEGTVTNSIIVSNSSTYFNSGTQSGQVTLNTFGEYNNIGTQSGQVIINNNSIFLNSGTSSNSVTVNNVGTYTNSGIQTGNVTTVHPNTTYNILSSGSQTGGSITISNGSFVNDGNITRPVTVDGNGTFTNNSTHSGSLTINGNGAVTNSGTMELSSVSFDTNNSGMSFTNTDTGNLKVTNSASMSGTITLNGISYFFNSLTFITNNGSTTVEVGENAQLTVLGSLNISRNSYFNLSNSGNSSPQPTVIVTNLNFPNDGGASIRPLTIGPNTLFQVLDVATLQSGTSQLNIQGVFETGTKFNPPATECKNTLIVANNGGSTPTRIQVSGDGILNVTGSASVGKHISASDNGQVNISCNLVLTNTGDNSFTLGDNVSLTVKGNTTLNKPMYVSENAQVTLDGDLTLPNVGSELVINDDVNFYVGGNTSVQSPIRMNDNAYVTFDGNVNLPNVGGAVLELNDNADVLITSNLTKSGGMINVDGSSQLVICDMRMPSGSIEGSYPASTSSGINVGSSPAYYGGCRILPVDFINFSTSYLPNSRSVVLDWSTAKEWENSHFEIERAINSIKEWETLGEEEGFGFSNEPSSYQFEDSKLPATGGNIFYRLKQVDYSGNFSYSITRSVQIDPLDFSTFWKVYPNPTDGSTFTMDLVDPSSIGDGSISVRVITTLGSFQTFSGDNPEEISEQIQGYLESQIPGLYTIQILWANQQEIHKIVKK